MLDVAFDSPEHKASRLNHACEMVTSYLCGLGPSA